MPNSRWASISSRPLLTSVAELIVTIGPMSHVGWASACGDGDVGQLGAAPSAERAAGGGEHQPGDLVGAAAAQALGQRGVLGVDGHDLAGRRGRGHERAAGDQGLLVGERERAPGRERGQRRAEADRAGDAVEHRVDGVVAVSSVAASGPGEHLDARQQVAQRARGVLGGDGHAPHAVRAGLLGEQRDVAPPAASPATVKRSGWRVISSSACVPIEPVEPSTSTDRRLPVIASPSSSARCCATIRPWRATPVRWRSSLVARVPEDYRRGGDEPSAQWGWHGGFPKGTIIGGVVTIILLIAFIPGPYQSHTAGHLAHPHRDRHRRAGSSGT